MCDTTIGNKEEERGEEGGVIILQQNCNRSTNVMQGLMEIGGKADIMAIQEPWIGSKNRRGKVEGAVECGGGQITVGHNGYDIVYEKGTEERQARVMWMIRKDSGLKWTVRNDIWEEWDASVLDVRMKGGRVLRLVNVYNQDHKKGKEWCLRRVPIGVGEGVDLMLLGDFNAKGALWDTRNKSLREEMVMEVVEREELVLLNERDRSTWMRDGKESVLDLTWVGENMERRCNWRIRDEEDIGSDHATIEIAYTEEAERIQNPAGKRWNLKAADWEMVERGIKEAMEVRQRVWEEAIEEKNAERVAELLEEVITCGMRKGIPEARIMWRSKKWFDEEVREKRKEVRGLRRWRRQRKMSRDEDEAWRKKRSEYFKCIRMKKKEMWDTFIGEAKTQQEAWAVWRMLNQRVYTKTPTIQNGNIKSARTFEEKEVLFREKLFPKAPVKDQQRKEASPRKGKMERVTKEEVEKALQSQGNKKAPGPDGILVAVLKKSGYEFKEWLREGYDMMLREGIHPEKWKGAIGAIIPKPGKGDYSSARSYRPVSLLNTMGKVLEKIVEGRVWERLEEEGGLNCMQWGGVKKKGAEECVEWTLDWASRKQEEGKKVAIVAMDIDQAFPNVARIRLGNRMRRRGIDEEIARWTESFMENRRVKLRFDGREGEWSKVETGVPQGSPISPLLFNLYIEPLMKRLGEHGEKLFSGDAITPTFIDDVTLAIAGESWEEVIARCEEMIGEAYRWAEENEVRFAEDKLEWIRLGLGKGAEEVERLWLPGGGEKEEAEIMRWLGVWLDTRLKFKKHVEIKTRKAESVMAGLGRLAKGEKGCGVGNLRKMYVACVRSVMDYGSRVWWSGQKELAGKMDKVEERSLRRIGGHLRTAPNKAIRVESNMPPTEVRLNMRSELLAVKAISKGKGSQIGKIAGDMMIEGEEDAEWGGRQRREKRVRGVKGGMLRIKKAIKGRWKKIEKCEQFEKKEKMWEKKEREELEIKIEERSADEEERQNKMEEGEDEVIMYTDGSKMGERCGVGVCRVGWNGRELWGKGYGMGREMEIMDAEMMGIKKAIEQGVRECIKKRVKKMRIRTDNQEAMRRIKKREGGAGEMMAHKIRGHLNWARREGVRVELEWVKAHVGTVGNEIADKYAKEGCGKTTDREAFISLAYLKASAKTKATAEWQSEYEKGKKLSGYQGSPKERRATEFECHEREGPVILSRLRTGHIWTKTYEKKIGREQDEMCECGRGKQTVEHILRECGFTIDGRSEVGERMGKEEYTAKELLYTRGFERVAVEIWKEFREARREARGEREAEDRELEWGYGDLGRE